MYGTTAFDIGSLFQYGVYLLLAALCLGVLIRALWAPSDLYRRPCCGGCGHEVSDILQGRCPECGGNYAKTGITTPSMAVRLRGSLWLALLAWTTLVAVGGSFAHGWLEQRSWAAMASTSVAFGPGVGGAGSETYSTDYSPWTVDSFPSPPGKSRLPMEFRVSLSLTTVTDGDTLQSGTCVMTLRQNGAKETFPLSIDLPSGKFTLKDDKGKELAKGDTVDEAIVEKWFKAAGLDTDDPRLKRTSSDLQKLAKYAKNDPKAVQTFNRSLSGPSDDGALQSNGSSSSYGPAPGAFGTPMIAPSPVAGGTRETLLAVAAFGLVYLGGCAGIVWRNRRALRA